MTTLTTLQRVAKHLNAFRSRPSVRFLDVVYGPRVRSLRAQVAAMILDRKVTASDSVVQWNNFRVLLLKTAGITDATCKADGDSKLEKALNDALLSTVKF